VKIESKTIEFGRLIILMPWTQEKGIPHKVLLVPEHSANIIDQGRVP
jgi:hypothetical protein